MGLLYRKDPNDKRGKWTDVFKSLLLVLICFLAFRWTLWEPYVIPSGSMETSLLIQDYVVVKKFAYGLRLPFTEKWILGPAVPKRGDIVVFKSVDDSGHILVKRVIGLPGDEIMINNKGFIQVNDTPFVYQEVDEENESFDVYEEDNGSKKYLVQFSKDLEQTTHQIKVPEGQLYMMGDNRNFSADSRFWGPLPLERIMGKLVLIWFSCEESERYSSFLCSAQDFRVDRILKKVD